MGTLTANRKTTRQVVLEVPAGLLSELDVRDVTLSNVARSSLTRWYANYERVSRAWPDGGDDPVAIPFLADDEFQEIIRARVEPGNFRLDGSFGKTRAVAVDLPEDLLSGITQTGVNISALASITVARWLTAIDRWRELTARLAAAEDDPKCMSDDEISAIVREVRARMRDENRC